MGRAKIFPYRKTKILWYFFVCLFLILLWVSQSEAKDKAKSTPKSQISTAIIQAMIENAKITLANKAWTIYVTYKQMKRGKIEFKVETDVLTFMSDTLTSETLSAQGYGNSDYRIKIGVDGAYIWEAIMLHKNQKDTVLLKGELKNGVMAGVMVYQLQDGTSRTGNFTTIPPE